MKSKTTFTLSGFVDGPQDGEEDTTQILSTHGLVVVVDLFINHFCSRWLNYSEGQQ